MKKYSTLEKYKSKLQSDWIRLAIIKNSTNNESGESIEKREPSYTGINVN